MKPFTAIAVSGGIDSLIAACLLKEQGHHLIGIHFITGFEQISSSGNMYPEALEAIGTSFSSLRESISRKMSTIAGQLDIPIEIIDCRHQFKTHVIDYFIRTYRNNKTPNPCMVCNAAIKFGVVSDTAKKLGATRLATGHYARKVKDASGNCHLLKGMDLIKDQSYFLAMLTQDQLETAVFPLGELTKARVMAFAREKGLSPVEKAESQDICFIKNGTYGDFLLAHPDFDPKPGPVVDTNGKRLGTHQGLHRFTVGQRKGINCPAAEPYYVVKLDSRNNRLIVGFKSNLLTDGCEVEHINWIGTPPETAFRAMTRIRYRHSAVPSTVFPDGANSAAVRFDEPQQAVTPGQCAVFYDNDEVLGGGWITFDRQEL